MQAEATQSDIGAGLGTEGASGAGGGREEVLPGPRLLSFLLLLEQVSGVCCLGTADLVPEAPVFPNPGQ